MDAASSANAARPGATASSSRRGFLLAARLLLGVSLLGAAFVVAEAIDVLQGGGSMGRTALFPLFFHAVPIQVIATATAASMRTRFVAAMLFIVLAGGLVFFTLLDSAFHFPCVSPSDAVHLFERRALRAVWALQGARLLVVTFAGVASAQALRNTSQEKSGDAKSTRSIALFALGLTAFALTRPFANDGHRPLKFRYGARHTHPGVQTPPPEPSDEHVWGGFHLTLGPAGASLDGEAIHGPDDLRPHLLTHVLEHPNTRPSCVILADPATPRDSVEAWLAALRTRGALIFAGSFSDHAHQSETLGPIHRGRIATWRLDVRSESPGETWGELAHRTAVPAALPYPWR
ncbi:MAG: hypothetical protein AB8H86_06885 [Polyangiales bacterium]